MSSWPDVGIALPAHEQEHEGVVAGRGGERQGSDGDGNRANHECQCLSNDFVMTMIAGGSASNTYFDECVDANGTACAGDDDLVGPARCAAFSAATQVRVCEALSLSAVARNEVRSRATRLHLI